MASDQTHELANNEQSSNEDEQVVKVDSKRLKGDSIGDGSKSNSTIPDGNSG